MSILSRLTSLLPDLRKPEPQIISPEEVRTAKAAISNADLIQTMHKHAGWEIYKAELDAIEEELHDRMASDLKQGEFIRVKAQMQLMRRIRNICPEIIAQAEAASTLLKTDPSPETTDVHEE